MEGMDGVKGEKRGYDSLLMSFTLILKAKNQSRNLLINAFDKRHCLGLIYFFRHC